MLWAGRSLGACPRVRSALQHAFRCLARASHPFAQLLRPWGSLQEGDEISMTDMAKLMAVESEEDDEDEEDDPDYEPLSMEEDSIQAREMVSALHLGSQHAGSSHAHILPE